MTRKFAILYVDDEESNLRIFQKTFRREYDVLTANSAEAGLEILEKEKIDLILSDQKMPQMSGVEFFKVIVVKYPHINRILITGYTDFDALKDAINEAKIFQYVQKPWVESDLKYIIENALKVYRLELELKESEEKFNKAFHSSLVISVIKELETNQIIDVNKGFCKILGYNRDEVIGKTMEQILLANELTDETLNVELNKNRETKNEEISVKKKNGEIIFVLHSAEVIHLNGVEYSYSVMIDITALKIAERKLLNYQINLEKMVNERTKELEHANKILLKTQLQIENQSKAIQEQSDEIKTYAENIKIANALLLEKQALVEQQKKMLEENNQLLTLVNSTKDRFFSIIAHDLRNPFQTISGFAEILVKDFENLQPDKIKKFHGIIFTTSHQAYDLLENLLIWARSQTGQIGYNPTNTDLFLLVEETFVLLSGKAIEKNILLENMIDPSTLINADKNMMSTILRNLISNAIKFNHQEGKISVSANEKKEYIEILVTDTGVGIEKKYIPLLFRIDSKYSTLGTNNETGTGLGLILCKEFVEKHEGKIWVESEVNKGSRFIFTLSKSL
jgi:PAS domain S-box-containing protein